MMDEKLKKQLRTIIKSDYVTAEARFDDIEQAFLDAGYVKVEPADILSQEVKTRPVHKCKNGRYVDGFESDCDKCNPTKVVYAKGHGAIRVPDDNAMISKTPEQRLEELEEQL